MDYSGDLASYAQEGGRILLDKGKMELEITGVKPGEIQTRVARVDKGATLRGHTTFDMVGQDPVFPAKMSKVDQQKLRIALRNGATHIGLSMVQNAAQVRAARAELKKLGASKVKLVAKIESLSAMENLESIAKESDEVMIARGDLLPAVGSMEKLHAAEKNIARAAKATRTPFIEASRFEGDDAAQEVARAKKLGPSSFVLKNTALDEHPAQLVEAMNKLIKKKPTSLGDRMNGLIGRNKQN